MRARAMRGSSACSDQRQEAPVHGVRRGAGSRAHSRVAPASPQSPIGQRATSAGAVAPSATALAHPSRAGPKKIGYQAGELEMRFFEEGFEAVLQLTRLRVSCCPHRPSETPLGVEHVEYEA